MPAREIPVFHLRVFPEVARSPGGEREFYRWTSAGGCDNSILRSFSARGTAENGYRSCPDQDKRRTMVK